MIGKYREADRSPRPEPPSATVQAEGSIVEAVAAANRASPVRPHVPKRLQTDPLSDEDLDPAKLSVGDSTQPLSLDEVEIAAQSMAFKAQSILKGEKQEAPDFASENRTAHGWK